MHNVEIKELLEAKLSGFKAEIKASNDIQTYKLDQLIEYQEKQNKRVSKLEDTVSKNTNWRIRITAAGTAIVSVISFVLIKFGSIISSIRELIKTN